MQPSFKDAITLCKSIMRNGYDAHVVNTRLQHILMVADNLNEIDLATDMPDAELVRLFPAMHTGENSSVLGVMEENGILYRFYRMMIAEAASPDIALTRMTPTLLARMAKLHPLPQSLMAGMSSLSLPATEDEYQGFAEIKDCIQLEGLPEKTLASDYLLGIRAFRLAANFNLPLDPDSWMAIVRSSDRILEYVPPRAIMEEWRKVTAENIWRFVRLLLDSQILHGLIPEITRLSCVYQTKNDSGIEETVLEHTLKCLEYYPEGQFAYDWLGTMAMLFHDIGKPDTAEFYQGRWTFYEHHRVGAKITRKILNRLQASPTEIDLITELVRNHMRFQFMMTDKGMRQFTAQNEYPRLIEMSRANIKAREDNFTAFNHNLKYITRTEKPEHFIEPLLNGREIMEVTELSPGPQIGIIRADMLKAQIAGEISTNEEAIAFAKNHPEVNKTSI